jgi:predicted nucleic acid-binding protein
MNERDAAHDRCVALIRQLPAPLVTTWAVMAEAAWILRRFPGRVERLLRSITSGWLQIAHLGHEDTRALAELLERYRSISAQLADVTLLRLAETLNTDTVFTLDVRDFSVFRLSRNRRVRIVPEPTRG